MTVASPEAAPLGSYQGLSERDPRKGCPRWPAGLLLRWQRGEFVGWIEGRCGGTNLCDYCAIQAAHENARMLSLDAMEAPQPMLLVIVGTRTATDDPRPFYYGRQEVIRALRDRFGRQVEYASLCEFTTGKGRHSGGQRRPHWNVFVKGIATAAVEEARAIVRAVWCRHVDAEPEAQYVEVLQDLGAAAQYVAMHFHKRDQAPPEGWSGQRFNCSRGFFFGRTRREMRALARADLQRERETWKLLKARPELCETIDGTVDELVNELLEQRHARTWRVVSMDPHLAELTMTDRLCWVVDRPRLEAGVVTPPASEVLDARAPQRF